MEAAFLLIHYPFSSDFTNVTICLNFDKTGCRRQDSRFSSLTHNVHLFKSTRLKASASISHSPMSWWWKQTVCRESQDSNADIPMEVTLAGISILCRKPSHRWLSSYRADWCFARRNISWKPHLLSSPLHRAQQPLSLRCRAISKALFRLHSIQMSFPWQIGWNFIFIVSTKLSKVTEILNTWKRIFETYL